MKLLQHLLALAWACAAVSTTHAAEYVAIPGGSFPSVIANDSTGGLSKVDDFELRVTPVTRGEFYAFVERHPEWRPDQAPSVFVDQGYLSDWRALARMSPAEAAQPVTHVSWFAAKAFCEEEHARLPTWNEWEIVAAASESQRDAREDDHWRAKILSWYARPATAELPAVGGSANFYGVRDMHGIVWEWVDDFNALLVDADSRSGNDPDRLKFCGAGAINLKDRQNYAILMRVALLSSLRASDSTGSLGFRCARPRAHQP
jgi:formylglycine-generating enzyme required for sulfatase activity